MSFIKNIFFYIMLIIIYIVIIEFFSRTVVFINSKNLLYSLTVLIKKQILKYQIYQNLNSLSRIDQIKYQIKN